MLCFGSSLLQRETISTLVIVFIYQILNFFHFHFLCAVSHQLKS